MQRDGRPGGRPAPPGRAATAADRAAGRRHPAGHVAPPVRQRRRRGGGGGLRRRPRPPPRLPRRAPVGRPSAPGDPARRPPAAPPSTPQPPTGGRTRDHCEATDRPLRAAAGAGRHPRPADRESPVDGRRVATSRGDAAADPDARDGRARPADDRARALPGVGGVAPRHRPPRPQATLPPRSLHRPGRLLCHRCNNVLLSHVLFRLKIRISINCVFCVITPVILTGTARIVCGAWSL